MGSGMHVDHASAAPLLQRLERVQAGANGWRALCPSCGGRSRKLSIAETGERVLVWCFGGCRPEAVIESVGLAWADLYPPRHWPESPEERRRARRAMRESGWAAALEVLAFEATVALFAARELWHTGGLSVEDGRRLRLAVDRIDGAREVLCGR